MAVNRDFKNEDGEYEADFINCVAYRKLAETINNYVKKGDKLAVEGRLQVRNYTNSEGRNVYVTEVIVTNIDFLETKKQDYASKEYSSSKDASKEEIDPFANNDIQLEIDDSELPF